GEGAGGPRRNVPALPRDRGPRPRGEREARGLPRRARQGGRDSREGRRDAGKGPLDQGSEARGGPRGAGSPAPAEPDRSVRLARREETGGLRGRRPSRLV